MISPPEKILIIRLSSLGDILLSTPLISLLKKQFPEAQIDFLVKSEYAQLVKYHPALNRVIEFDASDGFAGLRRLKKQLLKQHYRVVIDIHRNLRSRYLTMGANLFSGQRVRVLKMKKNQLKRFLLVKFKINHYRRKGQRIIPVWEKYIRAAASLGIAVENPGIQIYLQPDAEKKAEEYLGDLPPGKWTVAVAPGAKHFTKRWLPEYFVELIRRLHEKFALNCILVGGEDDREVVEEILSMLPPGLAAPAAGKFSLTETAALLKKMELVISNDSGLMHLAAAFQKPTVAIFGSTVEELGFFPNNPNAIVLENKGLACRPCSHIGRASCPKKHFRCMTEITPQMVFDEMAAHHIFDFLLFPPSGD